MLLGMTGVVALALQLAGSAAITDASLRTARAAQERFELTRRAHLPWMRSMGGRECDAIVGRYCYWYDSTETKPLPEPARVVAARRALIALLDSLSALVPENDWIAGQRVRYTIEGGDSTAALRVARACRATAWWCSALEGLTHHVAGRYRESDSAFQRALSAMPPEQRCDWLDLRLEVAPSMAREFKKASCDLRARNAERLWRMSQPLWATEGNDLRTEHFARQTMAVLLDGSANAHGMRWSNDSRELLLRYGWAEWFTRAEPSIHQTGPGGITGHDREPSYFFFPNTRSVGAPISDSSWALRRPTMPSRYAPRHVEWMGALEHQLARFPQGDSMRVVAIARPRDGALALDSVAATLGALQDTSIRLARTSGRPVALTVPNAATLVSVELYGATTHRAERARYDVAALECQVRCVSDLLLFAPQADSVTSLAQAAELALTSARIERGAPLGIYWQIGGTPGDSVAWATVVVEPSPVRLRWQLRVARAGSIVLRLPENARGRLRVRLTIDGVGSAERVVVVR